MNQAEAFDPSSAHARAERRWAPRRPMRVPITLKDENGNPIPATIVNLTDEGLMITYDPVHPIRTYTIYAFAIEGYLQCQCFAVWRNRYAAGLQLTVPIHPVVVEALARGFPTLAPDN